MSLKLPTDDRSELVDLESLARWRELPTFRQAVRDAVRYMKAVPAAKSVCVQCLRADGRVWLVRVGPRGGWRRLWDFGDPLASARVRA